VVAGQTRTRQRPLTTSLQSLSRSNPRQRSNHLTFPFYLMRLAWAIQILGKPTGTSCMICRTSRCSQAFQYLLIGLHTEPRRDFVSDQDRFERIGIQELSHTFEDLHGDFLVGRMGQIVGVNQGEVRGVVRN
jgi:hypothetical protein